MKMIIKKNTWLRLSAIPHGWGSGYVIIPKGHPAYGKDYADIPVYVHGGLTFAEPANALNWKEIKKEDKEGWVVGFDTSHHNDNMLNWNKTAVEAETKSLKLQLEALS